MQILERGVVRTNVENCREVRVQAVLVVLRSLPRVAAEDPIIRTDVVIDANEVLILSQYVRNRPNHVSVQDVLRTELRKGQILINEILGVLVDPVRRDDIADLPGAVAEWFARDRI